MKAIKTVGVAGAGTMGASMAEQFAKCGYDVIMSDINPAALEKAKELIRINQLTEVSENILTQEESDQLKARITYTTDNTDFAKADLVIEAIIENLDAKKSVWAQISSVVRDDTILASNTSGISITEIATAVEKPERFMGMHWINPSHIIPLIEIISGEKTAPDYVTAVYELCEAIGKKPVRVNDAPGFVLNRIQLAIIRECLYIADRNIATPEDIDKVMKYALGLRYACLGPFEVCDQGGIDIFYNIAEYLFEDLADNKEPFSLLKECNDRGEFGVKTGKGFYDYSGDKAEESIKYRDMMYTKVAKCLFG